MNKDMFLSLIVVILVVVVGLWAMLGQKELPTCDCEFPGSGEYGLMKMVQGEQSCVLDPCVFVYDKGDRTTRKK